MLLIYYNDPASPRKQQSNRCKKYLDTVEYCKYTWPYKEEDQRYLVSSTFSCHIVLHLDKTITLLGGFEKQL